MKTDLEIALEVLLRASVNEPIRNRCAVYRTAAEWCGNEVEATKLKRLAAELEAADRRCREFAFQFSAGRSQAGHQ